MRDRLIGLVIALVLFGGGLVAGRTWFPRVLTIQVDREIVREIERQLPGTTVTIIREVPGPTTVVRVPIEVTRIVEVPGRETIVTVTKPVEVPVEVVKKEWPQVITVTVGGVQSGGQWWAPDNPELVIGQVTPGVYAVPVQSGWRIESVKTVTRLEPVKLEPLMQRGFTLGVRANLSQTQQTLSADVVYRNILGPGEYEVRLPLYTVGGPGSAQVTWSLRW